MIIIIIIIIIIKEVFLTSDKPKDLRYTIPIKYVWKDGEWIMDIDSEVGTDLDDDDYYAHPYY